MKRGQVDTESRVLHVLARYAKHNGNFVLV